MATKTIPKVWLDKAIAGVKEYWSNPKDIQALDRISEATHEIEHAPAIVYFAVDNLLTGILCITGCKPDASNEDIYAILRLLGWEVSD